jgi:hypothetical protein
MASRATRTPLQLRVGALVALLADTKDELDAEGWSWFVALACEAVGVEAAKLAVLEAVSATRQDEAA